MLIFTHGGSNTKEYFSVAVIEAGTITESDTVRITFRYSDFQFLIQLYLLLI